MGLSVRKNSGLNPDSRLSKGELSGAVLSNQVAFPEVSPRFQLQSRLGRGGMGEVYRARDLELGYDVALKLLHSVSVDDRLRLKSEFRALADVVHPNLVDLHELFVDERHAFFTMELVVGTDFITYVTEGEGRVKSPAARGRLEDSARQLALALHALHASGKLHRDVKPQNVMVTHAGRVVLLDFGLSAAFGGPEQHADGAVLAGTIYYMAPEQAWGAALSPATDWYAYGATLYEAIAGHVPIEGNPAEVLRKKRGYRPPSLLEQGFEISAELDLLLQELLDANPQRRPSAERILQALGGELLTVRGSVPPIAPAGVPSLVGRGAELQRLESAVREGGRATQLIHVVGPSGIGKSSLLKALVSRLPAAQVLNSRCHPREAVAFNAIDGLIDDLIQRFPAEAAELSARLEPDQRAALARIFPALASSFDSVKPLLGLGELSVHRVRQLAFQGLCQIFASLEPRSPLLLWIDDVQWADADSGAFLQALLNVEVPAGLVLVLTYRDTDRDASPCLRVLHASAEAQARARHTEQVIELRPLAEVEAWQLVEQIAGPASHVSRERIRQLIEQADGVPFFICELARYLSSAAKLDDAAGLGVERLLDLRMGTLPPEHQLVLDVLSVAGAPLAQDVVLRAAGLSDASRGLLTNLERISVLRTTDTARRTCEVYHHRIRDGVLSGMAADKRSLHHRAIALALLSTANPQLLSALEHFEAAGDTASVRRYVVPSAERASQVLAFDRAAQLYQRAIELETRDLQKHELYRRLAVALASAGRGKEAGEAFLAAGDGLRDSPEKDPQQLLSLRQSAAEQFIQTGHDEQGALAMTTVLRELDIPFPRSRGEALRKATLLRVSSFFRSLTPPRASRSEYDDLALRRFDALWGMGHRLSMVDHTLTTYASIRCALDAIAIGEPKRLLRALATEAATLSTVPARVFQARADRMLAHARALSETEEAIFERAYFRAASGVVQAFRGQFRESLTSMDWAMQTLAGTGRASHFERALWQVYAVTALSHLGELKELGRRVGLALDEARQRDDRFAARNASFGRATLGWLAQDRVAHAFEQADLALTWAPKEYTTQHYQHFVSSIHSHLYALEGAKAWARAQTEWPQLKTNYFLSLAFVRDELLELRARAALGAAAELERRGQTALGTGENRDRLYEVALSCSDAIAKHGLVPCQAWAGYLRGLVAARRAQPSEARARFERAIADFDACEMALYREAARACLGLLLGGAVGKELLARARAYLDDQDVVAPARLLEMLAPGTDFSVLARTS